LLPYLFSRGNDNPCGGIGGEVVRNRAPAADHSPTSVIIFQADPGFSGARAR